VTYSTAEGQGVIGWSREFNELPRAHRAARVESSSGFQIFFFQNGFIFVISALHKKEK
jgi:hypothetical protein